MKARWIALLSCLSAGGVENFSTDFMVRVKSFNQGVEERYPWERTPVRQNNYIGLVLNSTEVLVPARAVVGHRYLEVKSLKSTDIFPSKLTAVDYNAQLEILKIEGKFKYLTEVPFDKYLKLNDKVQILSVSGKQVLPIRSRIRELQMRSSVNLVYNLPHYVF